MYGYHSGLLARHPGLQVAEGPQGYVQLGAKCVLLARLHDNAMAALDT